MLLALLYILTKKTYNAPPLLQLLLLLLLLLLPVPLKFANIFLLHSKFNLLDDDGFSWEEEEQ